MINNNLNETSRYVIYDFETTGRNYNWDQIIQVAAILTDDKFNMIDKIEERCRLKKGLVQKSTDAQGGGLLSLRVSMVNFISGRSIEPSQKCTHSLTSKERPIGYVRIQKCRVMGLETRFFRIQCVL